MVGWGRAEVRQDAGGHTRIPRPKRLSTRIQSHLVARIAVDFDGVLFDHVPWVLRAFRDRYDVDLNDEGFQYWEYYQYKAVEEAGLTVAEVKELLRNLETDSVIHKSPLRDAHARTVMQEWSDAGHEVHVVTARQEFSKQVTLGFLNRHRVPFDGFHMGVHIKTGYDLLVDDSPHNVLMAAAAGGRALLMDHPYNRDVPCETNPSRVHDWQDVQDLAAAHFDA